MKYLLPLLIMFSLLGACKGEEESENPEPETHTPEINVNELAVDLGDGFYGSKFSTENAQPISNVVSEFPKGDSIMCLVSAKATDVCPKKGCWMDVTDGETTATVRFKDYAFFMPFDVAGKDLLIQGQAKWELTSVDDLRHYAEDAGKSEEEIAAITEPKEELVLTATGVQIQ